MLSLLRRAQPTAATSLRSVRSAQYSLSHGHSGKPEDIEHEKQKNLKGHSDSPVEGAPGWNDKLASDSEAKVKATKDPRGPEELQKQTAESHEKEHPHGKK